MTIATPKFGMGAPVRRLEDEAFITGRGRYTDDIAPDAMLHGHVLRSPVASARIVRIDAEAARAAPGVRLVLTGDDLANLGKLKTEVHIAQSDGSQAPTRDIPILCRESVHYVGDAVAFVVADSRALAQDAAELIEVQYEDTPAVVATATALDDDAPLVSPELGSNRAFHYQIGDAEQAAVAFAEAAHVVGIEFFNNRLVCNYCLLYTSPSPRDS